MSVKLVRLKESLFYLKIGPGTILSTFINRYAGRYASAHVASRGPGDARPTATQIIHDELLEGRLTGKVCLIAGCSSGIGIETAKTIASTGPGSEKAGEALHGVIDPARVELLLMDQGSLASVRRCAAEFLTAAKNQLNILICNAGVMALPQHTKSADGHEMQLAVNHLSHFLLFKLLQPALLASASPECPSRVVMVSSSAHRGRGIQFNDINFDEAYDPWAAYSQSKTANVYMASEIERRYGPRNLHATSLMPGSIVTGLLRNFPDLLETTRAGDPTINEELKSAAQGAATTVWAAVSGDLKSRGGLYLENCDIAGPASTNVTPNGPGYAEHAYLPDAERRLWEVSLDMVGLASDI